MASNSPSRPPQVIRGTSTGIWGSFGGTEDDGLKAEADRRLSALIFGDLGSSGRESGRLLATVAFFSLVGPWVLFGDEVVYETSKEITGASVVFAIHSVFALIVLVMVLLRRVGRAYRHDYWAVTGSVALSMVRTE